MKKIINPSIYVLLFDGTDETDWWRVYSIKCDIKDFLVYPLVQDNDPSEVRLENYGNSLFSIRFNICFDNGKKYKPVFFYLYESYKKLLDNEFYVRIDYHPDDDHNIYSIQKRIEYDAIDRDYFTSANIKSNGYKFNTEFDFNKVSSFYNEILYPMMDVPEDE